MILKPTHKHRPKQHTFTAKTKAEINLRDKGKCQHPGCSRDRDEYHHITFKGMGSSRQEWINDPRNGVSLCWLHHIPKAHKETFWRYYWEVWQVIKFSWWRGQAITLDEWVSVNEYRLQKTGVDVREIISRLRE